MALISPATLEQIRAASDIVDVIGAVLPLKRAGANFVTLCPFHREKTPSFNVNPHRQIFHCFGCHKGGDVITFIREYENLTFVEAVQRLAERAKIPLDFEQGSGQQEAQFLKDKLLQIHEQIAQRWQAMLANDAGGQSARDYLAKRGVSAEAIKLFRLGYAPDQWDDTVNWATSKRYDMVLMEQSGLVIGKEREAPSPEEEVASPSPPTGGEGRGEGASFPPKRYYDRFRGRLMFPICDEQGRVIAFSGRVLAGDDERKYVNSPETAIFKKSKVFFGLDKSKRAILDAGFAIVCEGQLDLIACYMAGVKNIVAPQGTAFTPDHARILKRYVDEVVLCFDSDTAGQKAAARVEESLLATGFTIRVATIPSPHDPDSFIKERGGSAFQELITNARGFFDFYLDYLCAINHAETEKGQRAVLTQMAEMINKSGDRVLADKYAQLTAFKLSSYMKLPISTEAVRAEFQKVKPKRANQLAADDAAEPVSAPAPEAKPSEREFWLLRFILGGDEQLDWVTQNLELDWIDHALVREIVSKRLHAHQNQSWQGIPSLLQECNSDAAQQLITRAVAEPLSNERIEKGLIGAVQMLQRDFMERELRTLRERRIQPGLSEAEGIEIEKRMMELRRALPRTKLPPAS